MDAIRCYVLGIVSSRLLQGLQAGDTDDELLRVVLDGSSVDLQEFLRGLHTVLAAVSGFKVVSTLSQAQGHRQQQNCGYGWAS